ncbi:MAG TPA: hypothetical protein VFZ09_46945 [Archangium sp.]|uniref:hypothetical protein n=1 Tax=Archangium sp. TaxID=1872627 RepID=UPI002E346E7C|nr:hypothetical protein [Archangium sp.]HEX5753813.1 hypothetical protein [Archangium sp.]
MQGRIAMLCLASLLTVTSARAQEAQTSAAEAQPAPRLNRVQGVGDIDARAMLNADIVLAFVNLGVGADVGVLPLGPGVLALGGEFEIGGCVSACLLLNTLTGYSWSSMFYSPHVRASYHLLPSNSPGLEKVDLYGLALAGATLTTTRVAGTVSGGSGSSTDFEYVGSDVGPSVGLGLGAKYFFSDNLFFGAEGRLRYSAGQYTYTARAGNVTISDSQSTWSLSGFNVQLFAGLRL